MRQSAGEAALALAVDGMAAWRVTHLITGDALPPVAKVRDAVLDRYGPDSAVSYFVTCVFCVGVWSALGVAVARRFAPAQWRTVSRLLAVAAASPIIESHL